MLALGTTGLGWEEGKRSKNLRRGLTFLRSQGLCGCRQAVSPAEQLQGLQKLGGAQQAGARDGGGASMRTVKGCDGSEKACRYG